LGSPVVQVEKVERVKRVKEVQRVQGFGSLSMIFVLAYLN
jgi:hypothetical protein